METLPIEALLKDVAGSIALGVEMIAALTITGDTPCYATNVVYRVDTPTARAFLADYVTLP